jgi:hypothetical protein
VFIAVPSFLALRASNMQLAPNSASSCAIANPIPWLLPQMMAFFPSNDRFINNYANEAQT